MASYIDKAMLARHAGLAEKHAYIVNARTANWHLENNLFEQSGRIQANDARMPDSVWRDFDTSVKEVMTGDEGGSLLADLQPLARSVDVGKIISEYRKFSDAEMEVRTSVDGQHAKPVNNSSYEFDGVLLPVHSTQVARNWRELAGMRSAGYDALIDDQADAARFVRRRTVDNFVNGTADLQFKGAKALGIVTNPNTIKLDLGAGGLNTDLSAAATDFADVQKVFIAIVQRIQGSGNNAVGNITVYVSNEIWFNLMRTANPAASTTESMLTALLRTPGIAAIKQTDTLTGNALFGMILSRQYVQPVFGMPVTTTPIARVTPMDDWHVLVWSISGLQIKADAAGRSGVLYAAG